MKILAVYHAGRFFAPALQENWTVLQRGRHLLAAEEAASDGELMTASLGFCRNRAKLVRELGLETGASLPQITASAYRRWGADYAIHLEGPVVTVVVDRSSDRLLASRDRMGERRLFYCRKGKSAALSDHPDALTDTPYASRIVDGTGLCELFALGPARTPGRTPWRDVMALEPGCTLIVDRNGIRIRRCFSLEAVPHEDGEAETVEKVRELLAQAMEDALPRTDGAMLSGGLDSTVLTALAHEMGKPLPTFSVDYEGDEEDFTGNAFQPERDREYASLASELFSQEHHTVVLSHERLFHSLREALDARGFPGMADVDSSFLLFARGIRPAARCVLSGEGGDEVFCGYPWFQPDKLTLDKGFPWSGSLDLRKVILEADLARQLDVERYARSAFADALELVPRLPGETGKDYELRALQWLCINFFMRNLQERALCMCEREGVEVLTPYVDDRLAQYVWNVPMQLKFMGGEVKGLLRAAAEGLMPEKLLRRKKSPYPKIYSARYTGLVKDAVGEVLLDDSSPILRIVNQRVLRQLLDENLPANGLPWFGQLMSGPQMLAYLWQINEWLRSRHAEIIL